MLSKTAIKPMRLMAALAALTFTGPHLAIAAQEDIASGPTTEPERFSPEWLEQSQDWLPADMTCDQLIQFFNLFSASETLDEPLGPILDQMFVTGPVVEGWSETGIDMAAEIAAKEGSGNAWLILEDDDLGAPSLTAFTGERRAVPAGLRSYALRPDPVGLVTERSWVQMQPEIWIEIASQTTQVGNARCVGGYAGITLHSAVPHTDWSREELLTTAALFSLFDRISDVDLCVIYDRAEDGTYPYKAYMSDGRPLTSLNEIAGPSMLVPAERLQDFLRPEPSTE